MRKFSLYTLLLAVTFMTLSACGETEAERAAREQARLDSLRVVEQQRIAAMMAEMADTAGTATEEPEAMEEESSPSGFSFSEDGAFMVQVGAWRSEEKAQGFINKWEDRNYPSAYVVKIGDEATGDVWFRVRVGFFDTKEGAEAFGTELSQEINSGFWVSSRS